MCGASSNGGRVELHKGADPRRDQSYFLYGTTREQLDFLRFPLGDLPKDEVRRIAAELGLEVAAKPDSQDICFVPDGDYAGLVKRLRPETEAPGEIVDLDGRVLGAHRGVVHFTVGQRRGIEIGGQKEPLYVVRIEPGARADRRRPAPRAGGRGDARRRLELARRGPARGRASRCARSRRRCAACATATGSASPSPNMASRRARRRCSTTARGCSAAAGSPRPRPRVQSVVDAAAA